MKKYKLGFGYKCPKCRRPWYSNGLFLFDQAIFIRVVCPDCGDPTVDPEYPYQPDHIFWTADLDQETECQEYDPFIQWVKDTRIKAGV